MRLKHLFIGAILLSAACTGRQSEIAQLPTLAVLPTLTETATDLPEPTETPTVTPSATITDTPTRTPTLIPTFTLIPTSTPFPSSTPRPTIAPTGECDYHAWFDANVDFFIQYSLITQSDIRAGINAYSVIPYPACASAARSHYLNYLNEQLLFTIALDNSDFEAADRHLENSSRSSDAYFLELDKLIPSSGGTLCRDGTISRSTGRGTCSHHGGIAR